MNNKISITALMSSFRRAFHNIWKRLTGQERLYRMERSLQKKMLKCENEKQWEKLNRCRKKIRRQRRRIQKRCRIIAVAGIILLAAGTVKLGMAEFNGNTKNQKKKPDGGKEAVIESEMDTEGEPAEILLSFTGDCILGTDEYFAWDTGLPAYHSKKEDDTIM